MHQLFSAGSCITGYREGVTGYLKNIQKITAIKRNLRFIFCLILFPSLLVPSSKCQSVQSGDQLNLTDKSRQIENTISFNINQSNYEELIDTTGQKISIKATTLIINGDTIEPEKIHTRGKTTLYFKRKSFSFDIQSKATFRHGDEKESFKKFFLSSLSMDRNYCCNRLAFEMMEVSKLFELFYTFCELRINGHSEGIYMVIERPEDWALKKKNSPLMIRRGFENKMDKIETGKESSRDEVKKYRNSFSQIYRALNKYKGEELYNELSNWLDMETYMRWLAFNFFVRNGDYTDEVFFYAEPSISKLSIIPWDYDDLFSRYPHEGNVQNKELLEGKLFFSTEDLLDRKIVSDPYLYKMYLAQSRELMEQLTDDVLNTIFENVYAELYPYYSNDEIIANSKYDLYRNTNLTKLKNALISIQQQLIPFRDIYLKYLENYKE